MYFKDLVQSQSDWAKYEAILGRLSCFLQDCVKHVLSAHAVAERSAAQDGKYHHATIFLLVRHVCEFIDGVSVLAASGCSTPCKPLLRSALEAYLGICYILEADSERRALAYQVAHAHNKAKWYRKMQEDEQAGKELRRVMADDPLLGQVSLPKEDWKRAIGNLEKMLARPEYAPIEAEWQTVGKTRKHEPQWFELFGGPGSVRELAIHLHQVFCYEFLYRQWSSAVHASGCLESIAAGEGGKAAVRPIRHPEGLQALVSFSGTICLQLARLLVEHYAPEQRKHFAEAYVANLQQRYLEVSSKTNIITAPWR
jgi:hypothetical protein